MTAWVLTFHNDEERSHDGVSIVAVSDDPAILEREAARIQHAEKLEALEQEPLVEPEMEQLAWADWSADDDETWMVAIVPWGSYHIERVETL